MKRTSTDLPYLLAEDEFIEYAYSAIGGRFACRDDFIRFCCYEIVRAELSVANADPSG